MARAGPKAHWDGTEAKYRAARCQHYAKNVRQDFAHQTSYHLVTGEETRLVVFRKSARQGDERTAKGQAGRVGQVAARTRLAPRRDSTARFWRAPGAETLTLAQYKALRRNKLVVTVPPHHSSQECSRCGHTTRTTGLRRLRLSVNAATSVPTPTTMRAR
ncbi:zinc ribbon domain-containing protein [Cupriavidus basilensis]